MPKAKKEGKKKIDIVTLDNQPVSPLIQDEVEQVHEKFVNIKPEKPFKENKININKGRVYKDLGNGYGMYADDGTAFKII